MIQFENCVTYFNNVILKELSDQGIICWIAGGVVRDYFLGIPLRTDYDIFFKSEEDFNKVDDYFKKKKAKLVFTSDNSVKINYNGKSFDLVKRYFADPNETIHAFDFTVSMFAVDNNKVYHGETSFIDLAKKQLMINKITYPASTLRRSFRYYEKGFRMCKGEMRKLALSLNTVKEENPNQEQTESQTGLYEDSDNFWGGID